MEPDERPEPHPVRGSTGRHRKPSNPMGIARVAIVGGAIVVLLALFTHIVRLTGEDSDKLPAAQPEAPSSTASPVASSSPSRDGGLATVAPSATSSSTASTAPTGGSPGDVETDGRTEVRTPAAAPAVPASLAGAQLDRLARLRADAVEGAPVAQASSGENVLTVPGRAIGSWKGSRLPNGLTVGVNNDRAIKAGDVVTYEQFPRSRSTARVRLPSGQRYTAPVMSAHQTHLAMRETDGPACPDCQDVVLTGVRATTMRQATDVGEVALPAWEFTVRGSKVKLVRPALGPGGLVRFTPAWRGKTDAELSSSQLPLGRPTLSKDGRVVTARVEGKDVLARGGCWRLFASETDDAVAVYAAKGRADASGKCSGRSGTVSVRLTAPLGDRTVVDSYWQRVLALR